MYKGMYTGHGNIYREFDSLSAMVSYYQTCGGSKYTNFSGNDGQYPNDTIAKTLQGDESLVAEAEKLIEKLEANIESIGNVTRPDVLGSRICIADYLANSPTPFRRKKRVVSDLSPVRIFVGIVCSAGIPSSAMRERGITIMALAMQLQAIRPVEVILYHESEAGNKDCLYTIRLESRPISLAHCINALANVYVARHLTYGIAHTDGFDGRWPKGYEWNGNGHKPSQAYATWRAAKLGVTEQDILLESAYLTDEILLNPLGWINKHLGLYQIPD